MPDTTTTSTSALDPELQELQEYLDREIPMCSHMGIRVHERGPNGLVVRFPFEPNRNHQQTVFAGSLNALCTIAGWGTVFLLLKESGRRGSVVIRRGSIRYQEPVTSSDVFARCEPVPAGAKQYFVEMLDEKKQAKLDLVVEIAGPSGPLVAFNGSYVVLQNGEA
jgi:thioesterase domain-containing protein